MLALVTGGLHRIGAAIAARLAEAGYDLALHAHRPGEPDADLQDALERTGRRHAVITADLSDSDQVASLMGEAATRFGRAPDVLVNSASIISEGGWRDLSADVLDAHLSVNFVAPMLLARSFADRAGRGAVINILDQRILNPPVDQAAYTASKLALASVTRVMARAFAPAVRVNAVAPGNTLPAPGYGAAQWDRLAGAMPLGRNPEAGDIAEAVAYLVGAEAVTGQILFVDGGAALESYSRDFVHMMRD